MHKAFLNWSSGKDGAFALYKLQQQKTLHVERLVTTQDSASNRVSMHDVQVSLLQKQAESLGLPLYLISLSGNVSVEEYNAVMQHHMDFLKMKGFTHSVFGDIFLDDLRSFRERKLQQAGMKGVFPLWKQDTTNLIREFIDAGFKAVTVCVNARLLDKSFCGRLVDKDFLKELPAHIDPCGENGEFHTFVYDGPNFSLPVGFTMGETTKKTFPITEKVEKNAFTKGNTSWETEFWYADLRPCV